MDQIRVGDRVEHVEQIGSVRRVVCTARVIRETKTQWLTCDDHDPEMKWPTRWRKDTLAMVPQYVSPRFIRKTGSTSAKIDLAFGDPK